MRGKANKQNIDKHNHFYHYLQEKSKTPNNQLHSNVYVPMPINETITHHNPKPMAKPPKEHKNKPKQSKPIYLDIIGSAVDSPINTSKTPFKDVWTHQQHYQSALVNTNESCIEININGDTPILPELCSYLLGLLQISNKISISISLKINDKYLDMLSIKKEPKPNRNGFVKTYITNNSKSKTILVKLLEFASDGEQQIKDKKIVVIEVEMNSKVQNEKKKVQIWAETRTITEILRFNRGGMKVVRVSQWGEEVEKYLVKEQSQQKELKKQEMKLKRIIDNLEEQLKQNQQQLQLYIDKVMNIENEQLGIASERASIGLLHYLHTKINLSHHQ